MATHLIPRNTKGENRILMIFSTKGDFIWFYVGFHQPLRHNLETSSAVLLSYFNNDVVMNARRMALSNASPTESTP